MCRTTFNVCLTVRAPPMQLALLQTLGRRENTGSTGGAEEASWAIQQTSGSMPGKLSSRATTELQRLCATDRLMGAECDNQQSGFWLGSLVDIMSGTGSGLIPHHSCPVECNQTGHEQWRNGNRQIRRSNHDGNDGKWQVLCNKMPQLPVGELTLLQSAKIQS